MAISRFRGVRPLVACLVGCAACATARRESPPYGEPTRAPPVEWSAILEACTGASGFSGNELRFASGKDALATCEGRARTLEHDGGIDPPPCGCDEQDSMCNLRCKSEVEATHSSCAAACKLGAAEGCTALATAFELDHPDRAKLLGDRSKDLRGEARYHPVPIVERR